MKLLAGNSNRALAEAVASHLDLPLTKAQVKRFADNEVWVTIDENVRGEDVFVLQSTSSQRIQHDRWAQALAQVRRGITAVDGALRCEVRPDGHAALWHLEKGAWIRK